MGACLVGDHANGALTEAVLFNSLLLSDVQPPPLVSDDAGQFKVLGLEQPLCWMHAERHVVIWNYYRRLKAYREASSEPRRKRLERHFDKLFRYRRTGYPDLNVALQKIAERKEQLLLVLDHPEIPLHNNGGEQDIRAFVRHRKVSEETRSDLGRRCRDTFASLVKTCRKLCISFHRFLRDRIVGVGEIAQLADIVRQRSQESAPA